MLTCVFQHRPPLLPLYRKLDLLKYCAQYHPVHCLCLLRLDSFQGYFKNTLYCRMGNL